MLLLVLCGCSTTSPEPRVEAPPVGVVTVSGSTGIVVRASFDGAPLPGLEIQVFRGSTLVHESITGVEGDATIAVPAGEYFVQTCMEGLITSSGKVAVLEEKTTLAFVGAEMEYFGPITIACPPDFWVEHAPGKYTLYNKGQAWPEPWYY